MIPHGTESGYSYHHCRCDLCSEIGRARRRAYYRRNAEKVKASVRRYREANLERTRQTQREHYKANRERLIAKAGAYKKANPDKVRDWRKKDRDQQRLRTRAHYAANKEQYTARARSWARSKAGRIHAKIVKARRRGVPYTEEAMQLIAGWIDPTCAYCGAAAETVDHIIPISRGGTGDADNIAPACRSCNSSKRTRTVEEFLAQKFTTTAIRRAPSDEGEGIVRAS